MLCNNDRIMSPTESCCQVTDFKKVDVTVNFAEHLWVRMRQIVDQDNSEYGHFSGSSFFSKEHTICFPGSWILYDIALLFVSTMHYINSVRILSFLVLIFPHSDWKRKFTE